MTIENNENEKDQATAAWLRSEFSKVSYTRDIPTSIEKAPKRRQNYYALAASIAAVAIVVSTVALPEPTPAWAGEPKKPSASEKTAMLNVCSLAISRGLGELEGTGTASPDNTEAIKGEATLDATPTTLPPLIAIDRRGTGAVALFENSNWRVTCPLRLSGSTWTDQGLTVEGLSGTPNAGISSQSKTVWADGTGITVNSGVLSDPKTCPTYKTESGEKVSATCNSGRYLVWYPDSVTLTSD